MLTIRPWNACVGGLSLMLLAACGSSGHSSTPTSAAGSGDSSVAPAEKITITPSVSGTVTGTAGASQAINIAFNAGETGSLSNLTVTGLDTLPAGWSSTSAFNCATIGTGNGCTLGLTFNPTTATTGTLTIGYSYTDNKGVSQTGSFEIPYSSTASDNVVAVASPTGQVAATVGGTQTLVVQFNTDDGNAATALAVSSDLTALPAGWSSPAALTCATVATGDSCKLELTYAPQAIASGTLTLNFNYLDNSGAAKTGTINIPYSATTNNNIAVTASPAGQITAYAGATKSVTLTFTTDDGNPATALAASLSALPAHWSASASTFSCATVSTGNACQLTLSYNPAAAETGTVQLAYSYQSNAGVTKTGSASISYAATTPHAYIANGNYTPWLCSINGDNTLSGCAGIQGIITQYDNDIAFSGNFAYVSRPNGNSSDGNVVVCSIANDNTFTNCSSQGSNMMYPVQLAVTGSHLYVANNGGTSSVTVCTINSTDGSLSDCTWTGTVGGTSTGITVVNDRAYVGAGNMTQPSPINVCAIDSATGVFNNCAASSVNSSFYLGYGNGYIYTAQGSTVGVCPVGNDGTLSTCTTSVVDAGLYEVMGVTTNGSVAYVVGVSLTPPPMSNIEYNVYLCSVSSADGSLSNCTVTNGGTTPYGWQHVTLH